MTNKTFSSLLLLSVILLTASCKTAQKTTEIQPEVKSAPVRYEVVKPGTHPFLLFSRAEIYELQQKANGGGLPREMWDKIKSLSGDWTMRGEWAKEGMEIDAKALIYLVEGDEKAGREALDLFKRVLDEIEPHKYYFEEVKSDFFETENYPKAFAFAYDWLYDLMTDDERALIVDKLEVWCQALNEHTEAWWWKNALINCGAIPVGALGLLCLAIENDSDHPDMQKWIDSVTRRLRDNYFTYSWRPNGICTEGPCYAHYHKNATMYGEALRRIGGEDIISGTGVLKAMIYQRFQWQPQGGCGPIGDNTDYGRRVFQSIYLLGIGEMQDRAGLWTFDTFTDRRRLNPVLAFIFYPVDLNPESPGQIDLPVSKYFEITENRAGYLISRSEWDNDRAAYFSFVTRYGEVNHQHYDMNTFLFNAFDTKFATHENIYRYGDDLHGADLEHNIIIVDDGGMPLKDRSSAGDDCSLNGYMTGVGTGHFADYVRGDARLSYADRSVESSTPAVRAERTGAFVKQGPNPYVVMVDDFQKSETEDHDYHWQWYSQVMELGGGDGTLSNPFILAGETSKCAVAFLTPEKPEFTFEQIHAGSKRYPKELGLLKVHQNGKRVQYFAIGAAWENGHKAPEFKPGPAISGNPAAMSLLLDGDGFSDVIIWQPEEKVNMPGNTISCGDIVSNGFLTIIRKNDAGEVIGYTLGDGTSLEVGGKLLASSIKPWSISADTERVYATGGKRARENKPAYEAAGSLWLPSDEAQVFSDETLLNVSVDRDGLVTIE